MPTNGNGVEPAAVRIVGCRACKEDIRAGASKCIHCDSYQDWRRFLHLSTTVLALLVALVSVASTAIPEVAELLQPSYSSIAIAKRGFKGNQIELQIQNSGTKEGAFLGATLTGTFGAKKEAVDLEELGPGFPIAPNITRPLQIHVPPVLVDDFLQWPQTTPTALSLKVRVQEYGGETREHDFDFDEAEYQRFRGATREMYEQYRAAASRPFVTTPPNQAIQPAQPAAGS